MLILGTFFMESMDVLMDQQFFVIQRQDLTVTFVLPRSARALHEVRHLPGVIHAEPTRSVPARLRAAHRSRIVAINGLLANPELNRVVDVTGAALQLPPDGPCLRQVAERLGVPGDDILVEVLDGATHAPNESPARRRYGRNRTGDRRASRVSATAIRSPAPLQVIPRRRTHFTSGQRYGGRRRDAERSQIELSKRSGHVLRDGLLQSDVLGRYRRGVVYNAARVSLSGAAATGEPARAGVHAW
jgi:hypothetical protein